MTKSELGLEDFYQLCKNAVIAYPSGVGKCNQLQTFKVLQLERGGELGTDNMGAALSDKNTPYFYSRNWERNRHNPNNITAEHPTLTAFELAGQFTNGVFTNSAKVCYNIELAVMDVYKDDCQTLPASCESRSINQIYRDTAAHLRGVLDYLTGCAIVRINGVECNTLENRYLLQQRITSGEISGFNVVYDLGAKLANENKTANLVHVEMPAQKLYGTRIQIRFCVHNCISTPFTTSCLSLADATHLDGCQ